MVLSANMGSSWRASHFTAAGRGYFVGMFRRSWLCRAILRLVLFFAFWSFLRSGAVTLPSGLAFASFASIWFAWRRSVPGAWGIASAGRAMRAAQAARSLILIIFRLLLGVVSVRECTLAQRNSGSVVDVDTTAGH